MIMNLNHRLKFLILSVKEQLVETWKQNYFDKIKPVDLWLLSVSGNASGNYTVDTTTVVVHYWLDNKGKPSGPRWASSSHEIVLRILRILLLTSWDSHKEALLTDTESSLSYKFVLLECDV